MSYYQYQGGPGGTATYGTGYYGYGGYPLEQRPLGWGAEGTAGRGLDYGRPYDVGTTLGNIPTEESLSLAREMWQPKCVALATNEGMLVEASLPGVKPEDIDLRIVDGDLILSGERKEQMKLSQKFRRRLWLPQGTQMNQLKASFKDGVLHVLVPLPGRGRMGERRETMGEKQAYQEWGGMQQQQQMGERREAMEEKQTYQEWGGTQQQQQQQQQYGSGPTFQRGEEGGPMPEVGTKEETKPLLQKEKEKEMGTEERASGIFIGGGEAVTTGTSSV